MTISILGQLDQKIRDALDGARAAGAALAKSAHEIIESAHPEETVTSVGTCARADLLDREGIRALLSVTHLSRLDGMLSAYGAVLRILDDMRAEDHASAVGRIEAEAVRDAATWHEAFAEDPQIGDAEEWANGAFDTWMSDEPHAISPLGRDEAREIYVRAFFRSIKGAS
jgi:hypothetical protein